MVQLMKSVVRSVARSVGVDIVRIKPNNPVEPAQFHDLGPEQIDGLDRNARRVLNLLRYTKESEAAYKASAFDNGYHSIVLDGRSFGKSVVKVNV